MRRTSQPTNDMQRQSQMKSSAEEEGLWNLELVRRTSSTNSDAKDAVDSSSRYSSSDLLDWNCASTVLRNEAVDSENPFLRTTSSIASSFSQSGSMFVGSYLTSRANSVPGKHHYLQGTLSNASCLTLRSFASAHAPQSRYQGPRGFLINNASFDDVCATRLPQRIDGARDERRLYSTLTSRQVQLETYSDQSAQEMRLIVSNYAGGAEDALLSQRSAFLCVIMSRGSPGGQLYGRDGADFNVWHDLILPMNNCAALANKPKCYILLGCELNEDCLNLLKNCSNVIVMISENADCSELVELFCQEMETNGNDMDLLQILLKICNHFEENKAMAIPRVYSTLCDKFYLVTEFVNLEHRLETANASTPKVTITPLEIEPLTVATHDDHDDHDALKEENKVKSASSVKRKTSATFFQRHISSRRKEYERTELNESRQSFRCILQ